MVYLHEEDHGENCVRHWANEDETGADREAAYHIRQEETGVEYEEAVDVLPCRYHYVVTDKPVVKEREEESEWGHRS